MISCRDGWQSEELGTLNTGKDAAYRLIMHPSGRSLVAGMSVGGLERVDLQPAAPAAGAGGGEQPPRMSLSQSAYTPPSQLSFLLKGRRHLHTHPFTPSTPPIKT